MKTWVVCAAAWLVAASSALAQPQAGQVAHERITEQQAYNLVAERIDANHDQRISRAEWLAFWPEASSDLPSYNPSREFDGFDLNRDGVLAGAEFHNAVQHVVNVAQTDCDTNVDHVFSGAEELSCLADYAAPSTPQSASTAPPQASAPQSNAPGTSLVITTSVRIPGPVRNFVPVPNTRLFLSSRSLGAALASVGLTQPSPLRAWLQACQTHAPACQQGKQAMEASPAAHGATDAQGHLTLSQIAPGHYFVVGLGGAVGGQNLIWSVPVDISAGANELLLGGFNALFVPPEYTDVAP
ncbi:MAG: hypothetical protein ABUS48_00675 [Pseudomonadota bacterium]